MDTSFGKEASVINPDTMEPDGAAEISGDWQAAQYLARVVELIHPNRQINMPDLEAVIQRTDMDGLGICGYCTDPYMCQDCIVKNGKRTPAANSAAGAEPTTTEKAGRICKE